MALVSLVKVLVIAWLAVLCLNAYVNRKDMK